MGIPVIHIPADKRPRYCGQGYKTLTQEPLNQQIVELTGGNVSTSTSRRSHVSICKTASDVQKALSLGLTGGGNDEEVGFKAKVDYANSLTKHAHAVHLISMTYITKTSSCNSVEFKENYYEMHAKETDAERQQATREFYRTYGDSYAESITQGGYRIASYSYVCNSEDEKNKISASLEGSYGPSKMGASIGFSASQSTNTKNSHTQVIFNQLEEGVNLPAQADNETLDKYAARIQTTDVESGAPVLNFTLKNYYTLHGCPAWYDTISQNCTDYDKWFSKPLRQAHAHSARMTEIIKLYEHYGVSSMLDDVKDRRTKLQRLITDINQWATKAGGDPTVFHGSTIPQYDKHVLDEIPSPNFSLEGSTVGGGGGQQFNDIGKHHIVLGVKIKSISARLENMIASEKTIFGTKNVGNPWNQLNQLQTTYCYMGGGHNSNTTFRGHEVNTFPRKSDIHSNITKIATHIDHNCVFGMTLTFSGGNTWSFGGYDRRQDEFFTGNQITIPADSIMVGWSGRSGNRVDAIGPVYVRFSKPTFASPHHPLAM